MLGLLLCLLTMLGCFRTGCDFDQLASRSTHQPSSARSRNNPSRVKHSWMRGCWKRRFKCGLSGKISRLSSIKADHHYSGVYKVYLRIRLRTAGKVLVLFLGISRCLLNKRHSASLPAPHCRHLQGQMSLNKRNGEYTLLAMEKTIHWSCYTIMTLQI
jgi:hypothetical protein